MSYLFWMWSVQQAAGIAGVGDPVRDAAEQARSKVDRVQDESHDVRLQLERLQLACAAMWTLLKQHGHTEEELRAAMQEIDLRDGKVDGRLAQTAVTCASCGRKVGSAHATCFYCGKTLPKPGAFGTAP